VLAANLVVAIEIYNMALGMYVIS